MVEWFGHVERTENTEWLKRVFWVGVEGDRERGRPQRRRMEEVKELLTGRGVCERERVLLAKNNDDWGVGA